MEMSQNPLHRKEPISAKQEEPISAKQKEPISAEKLEEKRRFMEEKRSLYLKQAEERSKNERNGIKYTEAYTKMIERLNVLMKTYDGNPDIVNNITSIITDTKPTLEGGKNTKRHQKTKRRHNKNQSKKSNKKRR